MSYNESSNKVTYPAWSDILARLASGSINEQEYNALIREKIKREIEEEYEMITHYATNGEWMRSLTDEEFAWFIFRDKAGLYMKSPKEIIDWLKEEVKPEC